MSNHEHFIRSIKKNKIVNNAKIDFSIPKYAFNKHNHLINIIQLLYEYDNKEKFNEHKLKYLKIASQIKDLNIFIWFENNFDNLDLSIVNNVLINNSLI